ncbi:MFS transporter [Tundrisphaera lichenicola]|uniref:MFS transporter n=1 Tax=Tundrisphaera lichenicola TaxID=2029860 RepID=UPI003EBB25B8
MNWRWGLCWLMFGSTVLCYMDRQAMTLVGPEIRTEFGIQNEGFGWVLAAFSLSYALFQVPAGYLTDRGDVRRVYAWAVIWWSLAAGAMAFSPTLGVLMGLRAALGVGEAFNWPCALRATSIVLPPGDRSLGNGIFNSGAAVGAVLTPLVVPKISQLYGWRPTFAIVASLGFVWVIGWILMVRKAPREMFAGRSVEKASPEMEAAGTPRRLQGSASLGFGLVFGVAVLVAISSVRFGLPAIWWSIATLMFGLLLVARLLPISTIEGADWARTLGEVVRLRRFWVLVVVSISINMCWHFLISWLPTYLRDDRKMTLLLSGMISAVPFLAADVGGLGGGWISRILVRRGVSPTGARLRVMAICTLLISSGTSVGWVENDRIAIGLLATMALGTAAFMANYFAFCQDVSNRHTGFVVGVLGGLGNLFVAGFLPFAGYVKDITGSFGAIFLVAGLLPFVGLGFLLIFWGRDQGFAEVSLAHLDESVIEDS